MQSNRGYLNLCELLSRAWLQAQPGGQRGQAWLQWEWLDELNEGLIALSGADLGAVGQALLAQDSGRARELATRLAAIFEGRFYIELQRAGLAHHEMHVCAAVPLAAELGLAGRRDPSGAVSANPTTSRRTRPGSASPKARP